MERSTENVIEWVNGDSRVGMTLSQTKYINRLRKLHEEHPAEVGFFPNEDGSAFASVPLSYLKISPPRKVSDAQRQALSSRAQEMRAARSSNSNNYKEE